MIIYSRMLSKRLPGKAMMQLHSYKLLDLIYQRLARRFSERIVIASGIAKENEPIQQYASDNKSEFFEDMMIIW